MIILDSSVLRQIGFPSSTTTILTLLSQSTHHPLALPETVLREYVSYRRRDLKSKVEAARSAIAKMTGSAVTWDGQETWHNVAYPDVAAFAATLEEDLRQTFQVQALTLDAARGALFREADRQAPAQTGEKAGGARDASIWLTTLEACKTASPAQVFLVASDGDFGPNGVLRDDLAAEAPDNLVYCGGIDKVISALADPDETAEAEAKAVFSTGNVRDAVRADLRTSVVFAELMAALPQFVGANVRSEGEHRVELVAGPDKVHGFRAGDTMFATGELTWQAERVYVFYKDNVEAGMFTIRFKVRNTIAVAMSPEGAVRAIQVVQRRPLTDIDLN